MLERICSHTNAQVRIDGGKINVAGEFGVTSRTVFVRVWISILLCFVESNHIHLIAYFA